MSRVRVLGVGLVALVGVVALVLADAPKTAWKFTGQLEEACSCSAACPCWFGSKPTKMTCGGTQFLFIQKGTYGSVKLDGLAVGAMSQSPEGQSMMDSFGKWNFNYYYVDEKATPEQREALKTIASLILAPGASPKSETRIVPITRKIDGKEHTITLGKYGTFSGHLIEGGMGGAARIVNPPGADPLHKEYLQGTTTKVTYNDADQNWNFEPGTNYMYGTFTVDSDQYEKYAAGLAQKMAEMKKK
ncbi:MAG TPA: DUF1326 domain-containing protein [Candidatus Sulfotelmatobacter sp.]|jgi:hypothetical protein|nr:DUF1326 domain-containing protein [Candidatus Sulfotelmatobacter sp.]